MKVLLAEDEETIAVTLRDALEEAGHTVIHAADTDTALSMLERDPDVVLTDIRMPGSHKEGGMEILRRSVEAAANRPVILMTGFGTIDQGEWKIARYIFNKAS